MVDRTSVHRAISRDDYAQLPRLPLVICATLVQNPANLGGLCRTAEAFRLQALVLADLAIRQSSAFRSLAASTQHWQPLIGCSAAALPDWLKQQQQADYQLIGLACQPRAIPLSQFEFPRRSVLILGQELTGIPAKILAQCDRILTIPQLGLVDSLNVQTAAAIAVYEYVRQQEYVRQ